ncbi:MAG: RnfABCDGE type electron transport complex subunit G [Bacillota bacterium]|nr:RnfABCDGE type electron transport complex subunit G [Bacillota bacterium]
MSGNMQKDMVRFGIALTVFCAIAAGALAFTYQGTLPRILAQAKVEEEKASRVVMPGADFVRRDDLMEKVAAQFPEFMGQGAGKIFEGKKDGKVVGAVIQLANRGYGGPIRVAVAIQDGKVTGVTIIDHKETPGLGSKVKDEPMFVKQFIGKTASDPLEPKKDVEAITGATKSTRGVSGAVKAALAIYTSVFGGAAK